VTTNAEPVGGAAEGSMAEGEAAAVREAAAAG